MANRPKAKAERYVDSLLAKVKTQPDGKAMRGAKAVVRTFCSVVPIALEGEFA
jgi:hypothetical protein